MKTIHGIVMSTSPISLSKAASILCKFVSADTGASQAVCAYLRRASASFNELNQLHKEFKSNRKHKTKTPKSETVTEDEKPTPSVVSNQQVNLPEVSRELGHGVSDENSNRKKHKKKKKEETEWFGNIEETEGEIVEDKVRVKIEVNVVGDLNVDTEKKKQKKKSGEVGYLEGGKEKVKVEEDGSVGMEDERKGHRKKKEKNEGEIRKLEEDKDKMRTKEDGDVGKENERKKLKKKRESAIVNVKENGGRVVIGDEGKKKKRKIKEVEAQEMNLNESWSKKKKRKSEGE